MKRLLSKLDRWLLLSLLLTTAVVAIGSSHARPYDILGVLVLGPMVAVVRRGPLAGVLVGLYALVLVSVFGHRDHALLTAHLDDIVALMVGTVVIGWMAQTRQRALQAGRRLDAMIESSRDAVIRTDLHGIATGWNPAATALFGYTARQMLGNRTSVLVPPDRRDEARKLFDRAARGEILEPVETVRVAKAGRHLHVELQLSPIRDNDRSPSGVSSIVRDLTKWMNAQESLRVREAVLRSFHDRAPMMTGVVELLDDEIAHVSGDPDAGRFLGLRPEASGPLRGSDPGASREILDEWIRRSRESGGLDDPVRFEYSHTMGGMKKTLSVTVCPVVSACGEPARPRFAYVAEDVTDAGRLEQQVRQSHRMEAVGLLAGGIAHDFNNLLTVINGQSDLLLRRLPESDPTHEKVQEINRAGLLGADLTRQLLAFSRQQVLKPRVLDLNQIACNTERMLRRLIGEDIELELYLSPAVGSVLADPGQIEQIILNLAVNSRDAMPSGGRLVLETANVELDESYCWHHPGVLPGPHVMLAVSDTGHGMDAQTRARIFEPFFTTKEQGRGTGLGLATVYGIVKQSGGWIWVYSEPGSGTTFKVYFPRTDAAPERIPMVEIADEDQGGSETVLVAEDDEMVRRLVRETLESLGYTVLEASDGEEALRIAQTHPHGIDALITDVVMPRMSGGTLAAALTERHSRAKVLYTSGYTGNVTAHHAMLGPGADLLEKPFTGSVLARRLRGILDAGNK